MILLDTQVILFDVFESKRLSHRAKQALAEGTESGSLACSDISLWEIAMLGARGRIDARGKTAEFIDRTLQSRSIRVLPITSEIAVMAQSDQFEHGDPADRIVAATALVHGARLVSADARLRKLRGLKVLW